MVANAEGETLLEEFTEVFANLSTGHSPGSSTSKPTLEDYVRKGWDVNSVGTCPTSVNARINGTTRSSIVTLKKYTILHLACLSDDGPLELIKQLVEAGADINSKTEGDVELTPLHILLTGKKWEGARYLIDKGADLSLRGNFKQFLNNFLKISYPACLGEPWNIYSPFINPVELLVRMGCQDGLPLLDHVLSKPGVPWHGSNEFQMAIEGKNFHYILKVLQHSAKIISKDDINWITRCDSDEDGLPLKIPSLVYLIGCFYEDPREDPYWNSVHGLLDDDTVSIFQKIIKICVALGYNLNLRWTKAGMVYDSIWQILHMDFADGVSGVPLLQAILQVDHLQLNGLAKDLVTGIRSRLDDYCEWKNEELPENEQSCQLDAWFLEALKLLVEHGLDVSGLFIESQYGYTFHSGCSVMFKLLYCAGAKFSKKFFTSRRFCDSYSVEQGVWEEMDGLKKWKDEFDRKEGHTLKHLCRVRVRKMLKCVGDIREKLDGLPADLKDYVLCKEEL